MPCAGTTFPTIGCCTDKWCHSVRAYVPYGTEWYGYMMRRLAERPQNMSLFLSALRSRR